jgi:hypothetical protein
LAFNNNNNNRGCQIGITVSATISYQSPKKLGSLGQGEPAPFSVRDSLLIIIENLLYVATKDLLAFG